MRKDYLRLEHANPKHANTLVVNWFLGNTCNFKCSYCSDEFRDGTRPWHDLELTKDFCNRLLDSYKGKDIYFEFTGGEVTMWKHFLDLAEHLKSRGARMGMITNGSRTLRWWEQAKPLLDYVMMSFHVEFASTEKFTEIVNLLRNDIKVHVNIMLHLERFDECIALAEELSKLENLTISLQPLLKSLGKGEEVQEYTDEQKERFQELQKKIEETRVFTRDFDKYRGEMVKVLGDNKRNVSSHELIMNKENNWLEWKCYAGLENIVIDDKGEIFRGWCKVGGSIGNIKSSIISFPTAPISCNKDRCHCNFDICCTKEV